MKQNFVRAVFAAMMLVVWVFPATVTAAEKPVTEKSAIEKKPVDTYKMLSLFGDVFERVRNEYVDQVDDEELIEAAVNGMLTSLDAHSSYLNSKNFKDMQVQTKGEFGGLGIEVTQDKDSGLVKVVSPIDDTPAFRAGLKPGDLISHLDGEAMAGLTLNDAVEKMRGLVGTDVKLTIRREGKAPFDVSLTRAVIKIQSIRSRLEGSVGYIRITSFNEQTTPGLEKAVAELKAKAGKELTGFVLDLRNNPGGLLDQAISVSDAFLERGEIVSTRSRRSEDTQRYNATAGDLINGLPLVVLINDGSASASEIVAGALQDNHRAILLGTKSFGKGSVQTVMPLAGYGAMRLTTARYYTPSGRSIQAVGIEPDIIVPLARVENLEGDNSRRSEASLPKALKNPQSSPDQGPVAPEDADGAKPDEAADPAVGAYDSSQDYQLARALDLIKGLALYRAQSSK